MRERDWRSLIKLTSKSVEYHLLIYVLFTEISVPGLKKQGLHVFIIWTKFGTPSEGQTEGQRDWLMDEQIDMIMARMINPLPHMPILGSSNSAANKDMMSKILSNGDTIF